MRSRNDDGAFRSDEDDYRPAKRPARRRDDVSLATWVAGCSTAVALLACSAAVALYALLPVNKEPAPAPPPPVVQAKPPTTAKPPIVAPAKPSPLPVAKSRDWLHFSRETSQFGDIEVWLSKARCGPKAVRPEDAFGRLKDEVETGASLLELTVVVTNNSKTTTKDFHPWVPAYTSLRVTRSPRHGCKLVDNLGNQYGQFPDHYRLRIENQLRADRERIRPGATKTGTLLFKEIAPNAEWFQLELDNAALDGESGITKFRIPASSITWDKP